MKWILDALWFALFNLAGNVIFGMFMPQIGITLFCSFPVAKRLKPYSDMLYMAKLKYAFFRTIIFNLVIIGASVSLVVLFAPKWGSIGFWAGAAFTAIISIGKFGPSINNLEDLESVVLRYAKPGLEDDVAKAYFRVALEINNGR